MLKLKVFTNTPDITPKQIILRLEEHPNGIYLLAVDDNGKRISGGYLLSIENNGEIKCCEDVNPEIGFSLDARGRIIVT